MEVQLVAAGDHPVEGCERTVTALARLANGEAGEVKVFCGRPAEEFGELCAFVEAAIGLGVPTTAVTIVTPHPSSGWLRALEARNLGPVGLEIRSSPGSDLIGRWTVEEALRTICPELHLKVGDEVDLSVCGAHADHMVVSVAQMGQRCTADHRHCPHRIRRRTDTC
jgi:hypothetical protein